MRATEFLPNRYSEEQLNNALNDQCFHISFQDHKEGTWYPRIPAGSDVGKKTKLSEPDIPRICFSETLEGCFRAIYPNVSQFFEQEKYPWMEFYVYSPLITNKTKLLSNNDLIKHHFVHDAHITKEIWILNPVKVEKISKIKVLNTISSGDLEYQPFDDYHRKKRFHSPKDIEIEIMKKYKDTELLLYNK